MSEEKNILKNKKILAILGIAIVAVIIVLVVINNQKKQINVNDFIDVEFTGYQTGGTASCNVNYDGLVQAIVTAKGEKSSQSELGMLSYYANVNYGIKFTIDKTSELSNNDKVKLTVTINDSLEKALGIKFKAKDKEYKVSGLKEATEIDPFQYVDLTFSGTSPNATALVKNTSNDSFLKGISFEIDKKTGIKKGDTIKVTVKTEQNNALKAGYIFKTTEKTYECNAVDEKLTDVATLNETQYNTLKTAALSVIENYFKNMSDNYHVSHSEFNFEGAYVLNSTTGKLDYTYVVYSSTVSAVAQNMSYSSFDETKVYFPVELSSVVVRVDGSIDYSKLFIQIKGYSKLYYGIGSTLSGYSSGSTMYKEIIEDNKNSYNYTVNGNIEEFGK